MMRKLNVLFMVAFWFAVPASAANFSAVCGGTQFEVVAEHHEHPLDNVYRLFSKKPEQKRVTLVHISNEGNWFYAACLPDKQGVEKLVYQEFCGGSACVEDRYGIVDPQSIKTLLRPPTKNEPNSRQASRLLGQKVPDLSEDKRSFCCD
jgi:hypothetical protein